MAILLALHLYQPVHWHHRVVKVRHDEQRAKDDKPHHENPEGERQEVIDLVRCARNVQEEHKMHTHLRYGENTK